MWKLLSVSVIGAAVLFGATVKDIQKFVKRGLSSNPNLKVYKVKVLEKQPVPELPGWEAFFVEFQIGLKRGNQEKNITQTDILFAKGRFVAPDLVDVKTNSSYKRRLIRSLDSSFYDKTHLLYGLPNAKHKLVVFSDPNCPFCKEVVPKLIEVAKKYPNTFALYYYHLPLKALHPASIPLAKAIIYLKRHGDKEAIEKIYKSDFDYAQKDEKKVLAELKKKLGIELTPKQINEPEVVNELKSDMQKAQKLMIHGTPTLFVDGKYDRTRSLYKKYIPKESK